MPPHAETDRQSQIVPCIKTQPIQLQLHAFSGRLAPRFVVETDLDGIFFQSLQPTHAGALQLFTPLPLLARFIARRTFS